MSRSVDQIRIGIRKGSEIVERNNAVVRSLKTGRHASDVARDFDLTRSEVRRINCEHYQRRAVIGEVA